MSAWNLAVRNIINQAPVEILQHRTCLWCETKFVPKFDRTTMCSQACRKAHFNKVMRDRKKTGEEPDVRHCTCPVCSTKFDTTRVSQVTCSKVCSKKWHNVALKKRMLHRANREKTS